MYDKIKLKLCAWALPSNYRWQDVVARLALSQYRGDDTGGSGKWRGRKVIATETYVSFEGSLPKCLWGHNTRGKSSVSCPLKPSDSAPLKHSTMPP
ncbi:hypothetical protein [Phocaeicola dorei]|uniref:hypothetical protein n=1 Tax=Phocaeicola dorei TaxID=357276 RepID=UPI00356634E2